MAVSKNTTKFIRDKHGRVVLWQFPSPVLIGWAGCRVAALFVDGSAKRNLGYIGTGFLLVWAILEITQGASNFRRMLGGLVLLVIISSIIFS